MANKKYKLTDGNYWATDGIHDFGQNKTQREINAALVQADSDLSGAINGTIIRAPNYYGATDINSVVAYGLSVRSGDVSKYNARMFWFLANYSSGATGYFGTSSFGVICCFTSDNYGYGIMFSDNAKSFASFRKSASTVELYPIGDFKSNINTVQDEITNNIESGKATKHYSAGEYILSNGVLRRAKSDIASGESITDSNTSSRRLAEDMSLYVMQLSGGGSGTYNTSFCNAGNIYYRQVGRWMMLSGWIRLSAEPTQSTDVLVTGLPKFTINQTIVMYDQNDGTFCAAYAEPNATQITRSSYSFSGRVGHILNFVGVYLVNL